MARTKTADRVRKLFNAANSGVRTQWKKVNQKGWEYANDNQLSHEVKKDLEEQGMPTFTINRISPIVEMLNYYATANKPRWQAIGREGSDSDVAAVFSDLMDYVWSISDGETVYSNVINSCITKSVGYVVIDIDPDMDNGMGEVVVKQPEPFDVYVDPKSRDILHRDAAFIFIRKVLPKSHLLVQFPEYKRKIAKASSEHLTSESQSYRTQDDTQKDFYYDDTDIHPVNNDGDDDEVQEYFELYEKIKVPYINVFYKKMPDAEQLRIIKQQVEVKMREMQDEMAVAFLELQRQLAAAVESGEMLPERMQLELEKAKEQNEQQLISFEEEYMSQMQAEVSKIENLVISEKEFELLQKDRAFANMIVDHVRFYDSRIKQTCVVGDTLLYEKVFPENIKDFPIIPFHFKWTGTPYPMSAVSPLIGKQTEINKSHQIMVHNASLGSSLRWIYDEGSIDTEIWEKYSSAPGALLPKRPGQEAPTPIQPMPLSNAFFTMVQEGKQDMEYLSGVYSSMQGNAQAQHDTFKGMLAVDEYGTRRVKQWMSQSIEPALRQLGRIMMQFIQATYKANKRFRVIQPSALQADKEVEINIPIFSDMGHAIGRSMDISTGIKDVKVVAGSTLPVNRWAYLAELKELLQFGVVDDIAVLAETDVKNKEQIAQRKSLYAQLQNQISSLEEEVKDGKGTIETLERQLVQAGIKGKIMAADVEVQKQKQELKGKATQEFTDTKAQQKLLRKRAELEDKLRSSDKKSLQE